MKGVNVDTIPPIIMVPWRMDPSNISFLSFRVIFHSHDYGSYRVNIGWTTPLPGCQSPGYHQHQQSKTSTRRPPPCRPRSASPRSVERSEISPRRPPACVAKTGLKSGKSPKTNGVEKQLLGCVDDGGDVDHHQYYYYSY